MKRIFLLLPFIIAAASCSEIDESVAPVESQVDICASIGLPSRISDDGTRFVHGDVVKVQNTGRTDNNVAEFTYNEDTDSWTASSPLYWSNQGEDSFLAWHPASAAYSSFTLPADQRDGTDMADWMTTSVVAKKADGSIQLSFAHHLAKVAVRIKEWKDEFASDEREVSSLKILSTSTVFANNDGEISSDLLAQYIETFMRPEGNEFSAIIAPGVYEVGDEIIRMTVGGKELVVKLAESLTILAANSYVFSIVVGKDVMSLSYDGVSVQDWGSDDLGEVGLENAVLELAPEAETDVEAHFGGGEVFIPLNTNVPYDVDVEYGQGDEELISVVNPLTKSSQSGLTLNLLPNKGTSLRTAVVKIICAALNKVIEIVFEQPAFEGLDDSSFPTTSYMTYIENEYHKGSGTAFDYDSYYYCSTISNPCTSARTWEFKFKLASAPSTYGEYYLFAEYVGRDNTKEVCLKQSGLAYNSSTRLTWEQMGVAATDIITMKFEGTNVIVNGTTLEFGSRPAVEYIFSSYYYDRDDGVSSIEYGFQDGARMYYVKGWDTNGRLVYLGGPSMEMNGSTREACWVANYYDTASGTVNSKKTFSYKGGDKKEPFGSGNMY